MKITAAMVKELREKTGVGMMDAKKALVEKNGNMEEAMAFLREKGLAASAKKAGRIAAEGLVAVASNEDNTQASIAEVNCETDFAAKNENFKGFVNKIAEFVNKNEVKDVESLMKMKDGENTIEELQTEVFTIIREKISIRRFATLKGNFVQTYLHSNGRVAAIIAFKADEETLKNDKFRTLAKNITMHIAAMKPIKLSYKELDPAFVEEETKGAIERVKKENEERKRLGKHLLNIPRFVSKLQLTEEVLKEVEKEIREELLAAGKPERILDKIIPGKMERFIADNTSLDQEYCLLDQFYALDDKKTVGKVIEEVRKEIGSDFEITEFIRYEVGEGMEKRKENFAEEVAAQMK